MGYFIHGTSSVALESMVTKTDGKMLSIVEMLQQYKLAPMTGEIHQGGLLFSLGDAKGKTRFGLLSTPEGEQYSVEEIMRCYATPEIESTDAIKETLISVAQTALNQAFHNINILLVYISRAQQRGITLSDCLNEVKLYESSYKNGVDEELSDCVNEDELMGRLEATIQYYYLVLMLGKYIFPKEENFIVRSDKSAEDAESKGDSDLDEYDSDSDNESESDEDITDIHTEIWSTLTFAKLIKRIKANNINIKEIHDKEPEEITSDEKEKILKLLELPDGRQAFAFGDNTLEDKSPKPGDKRHSAYFAEEQLMMWQDPDFLRGKKYGFSINALLSSMAKGSVGKDFFNGCDEGKSKFQGLSNFINKFIEFLEDRQQILKRLLHDEHQDEQSRSVVVSDEQKRITAPSLQDDDLSKNPFPVILLVEPSSFKIELYQSECRAPEGVARKPLKIGQDVTHVATNTKENARRLDRFFKKNGLHNMQITTFKRLKKMRDKHKPFQPLDCRSWTKKQLAYCFSSIVLFPIWGDLILGSISSLFLNVVSCGRRSKPRLAPIRRQLFLQKNREKENVSVKTPLLPASEKSSPKNSLGKAEG